MMLAGSAVQGQANSDKDKKDVPNTGLVLHLNVRRVPVDVVVLDKQGNVARGLKKDDFIGKEDGKKQQVLSFDWVDGTKPSLPLPDAAFIRLEVRDTRTNRTGTLEVPLPLKPETATASAGTGVKGTTTP